MDENRFRAYEAAAAANDAPNLEAQANALQRQRIEKLGLALGLVLQRLALERHGFHGVEVDPEELGETAKRLVGELDLDRVITVDTERLRVGYDGQPIDLRTLAIGKLVKGVMADRGLSLRAVAHMVGCSHTAIADVQRGMSSYKTALATAKALGLDINEEQLANEA